MTYIILLFGTIILLGGLVLSVRPDTIFRLFASYATSKGLYFFAIAIRVFLGTALVAGASESRFPAALQVLGWLSIFSALVLAVIGRTRFQGIIQWGIELAPQFRWLAGTIAILLGVFLVYAVL